MSGEVLVEFDVAGTPATQGSKRAFVIKGTNRAAIKEDNARNKDWRAQVAHAARLAMEGREVLDGAVVAVLAFRLRRPAGHYGTGKNAARLKPSAPRHPIGKPDLTKLYRCVEDAMKGIVWLDDCQVVGYGDTHKRYALRREAEGVTITIKRA